MKNTIITLASVAALTSAVNAQSWDVSQLTVADVYSASGQDLDIFGDGSLLANFKGAGSPTTFTPISSSEYTNFTNSFALTISITDVSYGIDTLTYEFGGLNGGELVNFNGNNPGITTSPSSGAWTLISGSPVDRYEMTAGPTNGNFISDLSTGLTQTFNFTGSDITVFNMSSTAVPEPSSAMLLGLGALGLIGRRKRA